jgi:RHS repeat-associated protein
MNDDGVKGLGNQQDYGMRIYDPRVGIFLSVDPITRQYSMLTPYQFASNRPIDGVDLDGREYSAITSWLADKVKASRYPRLSGAIRCLGAGDIQSQAQGLITNVTKGNVKAVAVQVYGYTGNGMFENAVTLSKKAIIDKDKEAQGELGMMLVQGAFGGLMALRRPAAPLIYEEPVVATTEHARAAHSGNVEVVQEATPISEVNPEPVKPANKNLNTAEGHFVLYEIEENNVKLKVGKADADDIMPTTGNVRRMHTSERKAKANGYPNAKGKVIKDLGKTITEAAKEAEAAEVRNRRSEGHELPLNKEKDKRYKN